MYLLISLLITIVAYGAGPVIYMRTRKRPVTYGGHKLFCIIYTFIIAAAFFLLAFWAGEVSTSFFPAFLWGIIFYYISKNYLTKKGLRYSDSVVREILNAEYKGAPLSQEDIEKLAMIDHYDRKRYK